MATQLSENAIKILERRYLLKDENGNIIETPDEMFRRVAKAVAQGNKELEEKFYNLMSNLEALPNSPTLMNAGTGNGGTLSGCFVIPIDDSMIEGENSIMHSATTWAAIQKFGGGVGASFSGLRSKGSKIKTTHGKSCGAVSVMRHYSSITNMITQGGKRDGANMGVLSVNHPEIIDFIKCKDNDKEIKNFNISVSITDKFMQAVKEDTEYDLIEPSTGEVVKKVKARQVFDLIVQQAHKNGEPGLLFIDKINKFNPTPEMGAFEATNPCLAGSMRLATNRGLLTFKELNERQYKIKVATDNRVSLIRKCVGNGADVEIVELKNNLGVTMKPAVPVFKTRTNYPVYKLETKCGLEVVATGDHKFFTPYGLKQLKELEIGDEILIQSGAGEWNKDYTLPKLNVKGKHLARIKRGEARLPQYWSRELGEVLGWVMGDGWVSADIPKGRKIPSYTVGMCFNEEDQKEIMPKIYGLLKEWTGSDGWQKKYRGNVVQLRYTSCLYYLLNSFGVGTHNVLNKRVPESIWSAPKEAVMGFLSALFSADGTISISYPKKSCSVRLASSSLNMLKDVQILLLNEGIYSSIHKRREAGTKMMWDSNKNLKEYNIAAQYELIIDGKDRDDFVEKIGFMNSKQQKIEGWLHKKSRYSNKHNFITGVIKITPAGNEDVYCTTEFETHSIIVNGCTVVQCGEQPILPYESCNLGSINLALMVDKNGEEAEIDKEKLERVVKTTVDFLDSVIDINSYPIKKIEDTTKSNRKIGLGVMGFADMLLQLGIPYNSNDAVRVAEEVMSFIDKTAKHKSMELALQKGSFPNFDKSVYKKKKKYSAGMRNATVTTIAPTGTIGLIADVTQGIEPMFKVAQKRRMGDVLNPDEVKQGKPPKYYYFTIINKYFEKIAKARGFYSEELMEKIYAVDSIQSIKEIPADVRKLFVSAYDVNVEWHIRIQSAFQKYVDNAVSKSVNLPEQATTSDIYKAYWLAYESECKGITVYRDNSRPDQIVNKVTEGDKKEAAKQRAKKSEARLRGYRDRVITGCGALYIHLYEDNEGLAEIFANMGQAGGCATCFLATLGRLISVGLRSGVEPEDFVKQLRGNKCPRETGIGKNKVMSCADGIGIIIANYLIEKGVMSEVPVEDLIKMANGDSEQEENGSNAVSGYVKQIGQCPKCGSPVDNIGKCPLCYVCGWTECENI